jgi:hypothetical protein
MRYAIVLPAALALASPLVASADDLQPGKYRQTMTSDMPGAGNKPLSGEECITQEDIDSGMSKVGLEQDTECKVLDLKRGAGSVSYRMRCEDEGKVSTAETQGTFTRDSYDFRIVWHAAGSTKSTTMRVVGKRVGACSGK